MVPAKDGVSSDYEGLMIGTEAKMDARSLNHFIAFVSCLKSARSPS